MSRITSFVPVVAGAVAGGVVALVIAGGSGSSTKTVTSTVASHTATSTAAQASVPSAPAGSSGMSISQIYNRDSPGVVDITVTAVSSGSSSSSGGLGGLGGILGGGGGQQQVTQDEGAGVVYDKRGDIVTDEHVVAGETSIDVHFQDGLNAKAELLGSDASTDLAVIRVNVPSSELHPIAFANSNDAQVGDPVVAIGSPFGLPETTTAGIVSAVGRSIQAPNNYTITGAIQTDAAINPGNSGGPLLDAAGDVLGLNDQIQTSSGDSAGVGFATPGDADVKVANTIINGKKVQHSYVGICLNSANGSTVGAQIATAGDVYCAPPVVPGSPGAKAGLQAGDVITSVDGHAITSSNDFIETIDNYKPGQTVTMKVTGPGGTRTLKVTLGQRPAEAPTQG
jgi:putative serine protease PepD